MTKKKNTTKPTNPLHYKKQFFSWHKNKQFTFLKELGPKAAQQLKYTSDFWLRDKQVVQDGDWRFWIIKAGRGFGKTKAGACWMKKCILNHEQIDGRDDVYAICGPTHKDTTQVMVPALLNEFPPGERKNIQWNKTDGVIKFPNGATIYTYSSETEIRGPNISKCWVDELAKWWKPDEQFELLRYAVRIGTPQIVVTTTPKKTIRTIRSLVADSMNFPDKYVLVEGDSFENTYLPESYREDLESMRGTRRFRQEALGELLDDGEDTLFPENCFNETRLQSAPLTEDGPRVNLPIGVELIKIVVSIDPAGSSHPDSDETGIIVAGVDAQMHAYILEDASGRYSPEQWSRKAIKLYDDYQANYIVAETNFGKDMVNHCIKTVDPNVPFRAVTASRGKMVRAEPVAAKYTQNFVHHVGSPKRFEKLEDQMMVFTGAPSTDRRKDDRLDAMVWALTDLLITGKPVYRNISFLPNFG
jgi:predicted phage terminase large subunit-like protein